MNQSDFSFFSFNKSKVDSVKHTVPENPLKCIQNGNEFQKIITYVKSTRNNVTL